MVWSLESSVVNIPGPPFGSARRRGRLHGHHAVFDPEVRERGLTDIPLTYEPGVLRQTEHPVHLTIPAGREMGNISMNKSNLEAGAGCTVMVPGSQIDEVMTMRRGGAFAPPPAILLAVQQSIVGLLLPMK